MAMVCAFGASAAAQAADTAKTPEAVMEIFDVDVQPSQSMAFEDGFKTWIACLKEHGGTHGFQAWEAQTGSGSYTFTSPSMQWGGFDQKDPAHNACGKVFAGSVLPHVDHMDSSMYVDRPELGIAPAESSTPPKYVVVDSYNLKPGKYDEFKTLSAQFIDAAKKTKWSQHWWTSTLAFGDAHAADVIMVSPANSWAEIGAPAEPSTRKMLESVYGKDKTEELFQKLRDTSEYISSNVYRYNAELSFEPKQH
jgi:hypothetical protein